MVAPDQVSGQVAVRPRNHINGLVQQESQRHGQAFIALSARHCSLDQALTEKLEDALVHGAGELHPRIALEEGGIDIGESVRLKVPSVQDVG